MMPPPLTDGASTVSGIQRPGHAGSGWAAAAPRPPPGMLALSIQRRGAVIELGLFGELDQATAPRLGEAMARLRSHAGRATTIVIDTSDLDRIADAGYRALQAALIGPNGLWDPRVALIVGPAVARVEAAISAAGPPVSGPRRAGGSARHGGLIAPRAR